MKLKKTLKDSGTKKPWRLRTSYYLPRIIIHLCIFTKPSFVLSLILNSMRCAKRKNLMQQVSAAWTWDWLFIVGHNPFSRWVHSFFFSIWSSPQGSSDLWMGLGGKVCVTILCKGLLGRTQFSTEPYSDSLPRLHVHSCTSAGIDICSLFLIYITCLDCIVFIYLQ